MVLTSMFKSKNKGSQGIIGVASNNSWRSDDGSARSIRLQSPVVKHWQRSKRGTKITVILLCTFLLSTFMGYRFIRHYNASLHLTCHAHDCTITIQPLGRSKKTELQFNKNQLIQVKAVKAKSDGTFVEEVDMREEPRRGREGKYKNYENSYKGPDENGNYLSYALVLRDANTFNEEHVITKDDNNPFPEADLSVLTPFSTVQHDAGAVKYHIILRQFRITRSRRRVKSMVQRIESYIKYRRQKLVLKENASPSVSGIIMLVVGIIGFILTLLIGEIWHEENIDGYRDNQYKRPTGPGARRPTVPAVPQSTSSSQPYDATSTQSRYSTGTSTVTRRR